MTDRADDWRETLRENTDRLEAEISKTNTEYETIVIRSAPLENRGRLLDREWKRLTDRWKILDKPRDNLTIADQINRAAEREIVANDMLRIHKELAPIRTELLELRSRATGLLHSWMIMTETYDNNRRSYTRCTWPGRPNGKRPVTGAGTGRPTRSSVCGRLSRRGGGRGEPSAG